ncbi:MAG: NADH-quinone oxidoreductase subunit J [Candidatus Eisenbacteria bacterium]|uniref:NADH-quinone oxidoreductase subunit J n=1 Tax=Eiseniibacteriota bacterium TaxID=2212470 RepID=A0A956NBF3_UNCEI|nr:NADH-quinone oxidoreductase subunit J [Candidatus Eisenbacteria bacterium]MCB9463177.1 NADH-quinone oxidoreductase subunit J [Candidatus Eisenbacteria bacterium]
MNPVLFYVLAATMVVSALFVVTKRSPLASALALALNMVALAGIFAGLAAPFLFIVQILVYAGAVIVLIVFVIMLLNLRHEELKAQAIQRGKFVASAVLCAIAAVLVLRFTAGGVSAAPASVDAKFGTIEEVAMELFARYSLSLEVVAVVLLVGILGAVVLAKRGE